MPSPSATNTLIEIEAWEDANGNGVWDSDEMPLGGVQAEFRCGWFGHCTYASADLCQASKETPELPQPDSPIVEPSVLAGYGCSVESGQRSRQWVTLQEQRFAIGEKGRAFSAMVSAYEDDVTIVAKPPENYGATTPTTQNVHLDDGITSVSFGFKKNWD